MADDMNKKSEISNKKTHRDEPIDNTPNRPKSSKKGTESKKASASKQESLTKKNNTPSAKTKTSSTKKATSDTATKKKTTTKKVASSTTPKATTPQPVAVKVAPLEKKSTKAVSVDVSAKQKESVTTKASSSTPPPIPQKPPKAPLKPNTTSPPPIPPQKEDVEVEKLTTEEAKNAKRLEKEQLKRERIRAKTEAKRQKNLNSDFIKSSIGGGDVKQVDDMSRKKEKGRKRWLWLLLLLLLLALSIFLLWRTGVFEVPITYKITPNGNVIEIASPDEKIPVKEFKFMPGDTINFNESLYLVHHVRNSDGEYNNMFTFRFKAYVLCDDVQYNIISQVNAGTDALLTKHRDYWYYKGIIKPDNAPIDILDNFTINITDTNNELSGKTAQLVLELETVYPTEEQIYEKFGSFPADWYAFISVMYNSYYAQGYR